MSVDSETPVYKGFSLEHGRWGTNLIRYYIFEGHTPYYTLLLSLIFLSFASVEFSKLFNLEGVYKYIFCALFLTFPQLSYQLVFTMQADAVSLGFLMSAISFQILLEIYKLPLSIKSILLFIISSLILMFVISLYQALIFIPIIIYIIVFFKNTYKENFNIKIEARKFFTFVLLLFFSTLLYYISVKLICPPIENGSYIASYTSGDSSNRFSNFYLLWVSNLKGNWYYGEKLFMISSILGIILIISFALNKKLFFYRFFCFFTLFLTPFIISFFITNGYNPPRIYLTSGIVFAFIISLFFEKYKFYKISLFSTIIICLINIYFITQLFYSNYKIFCHDKEIAKKIDNSISSKYPNFDSNKYYVYFYGCLPYEHHEKFRLPNSEIFGGSLFNWDNGSNYRIINFFKYIDVGYYKMIDNKETYLKIKDSMNTMPVWPKSESIKMINNVIVVKLGAQKGAPLPGNIDN